MVDDRPSARPRTQARQPATRPQPPTHHRLQRAPRPNTTRRRPQSTARRSPRGSARDARPASRRRHERTHDLATGEQPPPQPKKPEQKPCPSIATDASARIRNHADTVVVEPRSTPTGPTNPSSSNPERLKPPRLDARMPPPDCRIDWGQLAELRRHRHAARRSKRSRGVRDEQPHRPLTLDDTSAELSTAFQTGPARSFVRKTGLKVLVCGRPTRRPGARFPRAKQVPADQRAQTCSQNLRVSRSVRQRPVTRALVS